MDERKRRSIGWPVAVVLAVLLSGSAFAAGAQLVKNVDEPGRHPFQVAIDCVIDPGVTYITAQTTAPANKRLVIDHVSVSGHMAGSQRLVISDLVTSVNGTPLAHSFVPTFDGTETGDDYYAFSGTTALYADPGTTLRAECGRSANTGTATVRTVISGHLLTP